VISGRILRNILPSVGHTLLVAVEYVFGMDTTERCCQYLFLCSFFVRKE